MIFESGFLLIAIAAGLYMAWNIGANDVANSMATSVASKAITLRQAILLASVLTVVGATLVGTQVTETVRKGIVDPSVFQGDSDTFIIGMLSALLSAGIWLQISTYFGMPVSTTHSIVGAIMGFGIIAGGFFSVEWGRIGMVVLSWVVSPFAGGAISFTVFTFIQKKIINASSPSSAVKQYAPYLVFCVFALISLSVIYKGLKNLHLNLPFWEALTISFGVGAVAMVIVRVLIKSLPESHENLHEEFVSMESIFRHLQVITAAYVAFAHGANDVANSVGPLGAIYSVVKSGMVTLKVSVPPWILLMGGVGIAVGIATWGYRVMETLGKRITEMTPSRGFSAEFAGATTVLIASKIGMPISTTHTLVGCVVGVGLARGLGALNLKIIGNIIKSWLLTVPFTAGLTMVIYLVLFRFYG